PHKDRSPIRDVVVLDYSRSIVEFTPIVPRTKEELLAEMEELKKSHATLSAKASQLSDSEEYDQEKYLPFYYLNVRKYSFAYETQNSRNEFVVRAVQWPSKNYLQPLVKPSFFFYYYLCISSKSE